MRPRVFGGPMGTLLAGRGFGLRAPMWSAAANLEAPELVRQIHRDYVAAGAELVTANTTCAHRHDVGAQAEAVCSIAIELARAAGVTVAASLAMLPASIDADLRADEYGEASRRMCDADILLLEGFVDGDELVRALEATRAWPGPRWAALAGPGVPQLATIAARAQDAGASLLAVHCCPLLEAARALAATRMIVPDAHLGAYPSPSRDDEPEAFALALADLATRVRLDWIGSCCGSTPATTSAIAAAIARS